MAFHFSLLEPVSAQIQQFTDGDGFVPEIHDLWQDFRWCRQFRRQFSDPHLGEDCWRAFIIEATNRTLIAFQKLQEMEWNGTNRERVANFW